MLAPPGSTIIAMVITVIMRRMIITVITIIIFQSRVQLKVSMLKQADAL